MTDDKGYLYGKYIHKLTCDLDGCVNECPKCAYDKGRKSRDGLRKALIVAVEKIKDLRGCECYDDDDCPMHQGRKAIEADGVEK